ncbi:head-tail connector protein [Neptuniibacter sp.]|uniref:head-tail connector protein n=1 Tax=Neptuniibacter sp. TaxID=1962643 RepID=UPI0026274E0F|nr:head-tail connector protein [Neptuniibacter sp.]MCP4597790.1 phage gp6-like head-tail connector protein [Neptuniibacter sp.]
MPIIQATPPAEEPITLAEARLQCRVDDDITEEDSLIESMIKAATEYCEQYTGRPLITQEKQYVGPFSSKLELTPNLLSVESVEYLDLSSDQQALDAADYFVDVASPVGKISPYEWWPSTKVNHPQPVTVSFTCGYGDAADVPEAIKQCIRMLVGHWFENRESVSMGQVTSEMEFSVSSLLNPYRIPVI